MDPADLPGYAAALHDHAITQPEPMRLMRWGQFAFTMGATADEGRDTRLASPVDESPDDEGSEQH